MVIIFDMTTGETIHSSGMESDDAPCLDSHSDDSVAPTLQRVDGTAAGEVDGNTPLPVDLIDTEAGDFIAAMH